MQFDDSLTEGDSEMQKIVNRLSMVFTDDHTTELMIAENEEYQEHLEHIAAKKQLAEQKEKLAEQNAILLAKEQELAQNKRQLAEADALLSASIKMLASAGIPNEQIAKNLNISVEKVEKLLAS